MPVCDDCLSEVEETTDAVDPDEKTVIDADGNEIVSDIKSAKKEKDMQKQKQAQAQMKEDYEQRKTLFIEECQRHGMGPNAYGDIIVASRTAQVIDAEVYVRAIAICPSYLYDTNPFQLEFRMQVGGKAINSGWDGYVGKSATFATVDELVFRAKERMNEPMTWK